MKRLFLVSITLGLMAYVLLPLPGSSAPLSQRIDQTRDRLQAKRQREGVLVETITGYDTRIQGLQGRIGGLQARLARVQRNLDAKRAELFEVRNTLEAARDRLEQLRTELDEAERALATRLAELYKADEPDALTVVLEADGFADLLDRTEFLDRVSEQDTGIVTRVRVLKAEAKRRTDELTVLEGRAKAAADAILARRNDIAAARDQLASSRDELARQRSGRRSVLAEVRRGRARLEGDLRELEAEEARVQGRLGNVPPGPIRGGSGGLIYPVNGSIVSPFGMRWGRLHAGIDIAVPSGTPIRAADGGSVVLAGPTGGYGNYVCIQHGGSLQTCYAHLSSIGTSSGASVARGQVIGAVGCTGHCFGDHLHFETRVGGSPVDPLNYL